MLNEAMDILRSEEKEETEFHAMPVVFDGSGSDEFKIKKCKKCGVTPSIHTDHPEFGKFICRLKCKCQDRKEIVADCETAVMVKWNAYLESFES